MALHLQHSSIGEAWVSLLNFLMQGQKTSPRGMSTREILNVTIEVTEGLNNIFINEKRNLNYRFMIAEWLWIQAGLNDVNSLATYNSVMRNFSDNGEILSGAYGPRLMPQMYHIFTALKKEDSRQAVATIWTPSPEPSKDIPCTISLQWLIRQGLLHCTVNMRSSDVWLGLPYDYFTFSQLTNLVSATIGVPVGSVTMNLASSHLYDTNSEQAIEALVIAKTTHLTSPPLPTDIYAPTVAEIKAILNREIPSDAFEDSLWGQYGLALTKKNHFALEVLSGIDPTRKIG